MTEKGKRVLGIDQGTSDRHGGPEHKYWVSTIAEHLKTQGFKVTEEVPIGDGKTIDIVASREGRRIAFEIETSKSDVAANVRKCRQAGVDRIVVVTTSTQADKRIRTALEDTPQVEVANTTKVLQQDWRGCE